MAASYDTPTEYIQHHLTFLTSPVKEGPFWTVNVDTIVTSILLGVLTFGFMWLVTRKATTGVPSKTQAFVELAIDFVNEQVKSIYNGTTRLVAPIALTTFVLTLFMNAMDFLPIDIITTGLSKLGLNYFRFVPTADVNTTFALALSVFGLMIFYNIKVKGVGGWVHELFTAPFGNHWALYPFNFLMQIIEFVAKTVSHGMRLFGNMYAGELIFLLIAMMGGAFSFTGMGIGLAIGHIIAGTAWAIFHILIIVLQAFVFMMLALVYLGQAHDSH